MDSRMAPYVRSLRKSSGDTFGGCRLDCILSTCWPGQLQSLLGIRDSSYIVVPRLQQPADEVYSPRVLLLLQWLLPSRTTCQSEVVVMRKTARFLLR